MIPQRCCYYHYYYCSGCCCCVVLFNYVTAVAADVVVADVNLVASSVFNNFPNFIQNVLMNSYNNNNNQSVSYEDNILLPIRYNFFSTIADFV